MVNGMDQSPSIETSGWWLPKTRDTLTYYKTSDARFSNQTRCWNQSATGYKGISTQVPSHRMSQHKAWSPWVKLSRSSSSIKTTLETTTMMQRTPVASRSKSTSQSPYTKGRKSSSTTTGCAWSSIETCPKRQHRPLEPPITQSTSNLAQLHGIVLKTRNWRQKKPNLILNRQQGLASGSKACVCHSAASQIASLKTRSGSSTRAAWDRSKMAKK